MRKIIFSVVFGWKEFTHITDGAQAVESVTRDITAPTKSFRNGLIYILRSDKTYTVTGQEAK